MKKLFIFLLAFLPLLASADPVEIDGIYYYLNSKTNQAEVTEPTNNYRYSGKVTIPSTVTYNGTEYSVTAIGDEAFMHSRDLTSITIPASVTTIGECAFTACTGLTSVTLNNGLTSIGEYAFSQCSSLTSVTIPATVTSIGYAPFADCKKLASITVKSGNSVFDSRNNCNALIETASNTLISGSKKTEIPSSVTTIGSYAFMGISGITSITIPNSVKTIHRSAFESCSELTSIAIPNSVTTIKGSTFMECSELTTVSIGSEVTKIEDKAFSSCSKLKNVYCFAKNVPETESTAFNNSGIGTATLYVPKGCFSVYNAATPWKSFDKIVEMADPKILTGRFSVAADKQVAFSPGNLQYKASINWLAFADNQYDMVGKGNKYISSTYDGWIDLFGWGTSGYNNKRPYMKLMSGSNYGDGTNDLTGTNYDWGVYATIINGGGKAWKTLTADEWTYLLQMRDGAADKLGDATVAGTKGLVLLPDVWQQPEGVSFTAAAEDWPINTYTAEQWAKMEAAGAVFLPASGYRVNGVNGTAIRGLGDFSMGYYWTASASGTDKASCLNFREMQEGEIPARRVTTDYRSYGFAVRLVRECEPVKVKLNGSNAIIEKGKTLTLKATVTPLDLADKSVTWKSSDTKIATVTSAGKVKGVRTGTAIITCTFNATGLSTTCYVTVGCVKLDQTEASVEKGKTVTLTATVYPSTLTDKSVTWTSSNTKVATVSSRGKVKGVRTGTAIITCTSVATGLSATCEVTVGSVMLDQTEVAVNKGKTVTLKATVYPSTLEDKTVTWTSSNTKVATVSSKGKVKGVKTGTAIITCASNATGLSATCTVTVTSTSGSRSMEGADDELTGIEENVVAVESFDVYDLSGRKVLHQVTSLDGLPDGIYIVNGKKIMKKK